MNTNTAKVDPCKDNFFPIISNDKEGTKHLKLLDRTSDDIKLITAKPQWNLKLKDERELKDFLERKFYIRIEQCKCIIIHWEKITCNLKLKNWGWAYYDWNEIIK